MGFVEAKDLIVGAGSAAAYEQLDFIKTHLLSYFTFILYFHTKSKEISLI
jgi:hypothetical protein